MREIRHKRGRIYKLCGRSQYRRVCKSCKCHDCSGSCLMQLIDTHTHLYLPEFDTDRDEVINRAIGNGVSKMLLPNIDVQSVDPMLSAVDRYPGICYPMTGLHPTSVKEDYVSQLDKLEKSDHKT